MSGFEEEMLSVFGLKGDPEEELYTGRSAAPTFILGHASASAGRGDPRSTASSRMWRAMAQKLLDARTLRRRGLHYEPEMVVDD